MAGSISSVSSSAPVSDDFDTSSVDDDTDLDSIENELWEDFDQDRQNQLTSPTQQPQTFKDSFVDLRKQDSDSPNSAKRIEK